MKTWIWHRIWRNGQVICPYCYRRLHHTDRDQLEDDGVWGCRGCESDTYDMDTAYSWYWPFDILWPRLRYLAGTPMRLYRD